MLDLSDYRVLWFTITLWFIDRKQTGADMTEESTELQVIADYEVYDPSNEASLQKMFKETSIIPGRITALAGEINLGRSDESFKSILSSHKDYKTARRLRLQFWNMYNIFSMSKAKTPLPVTSVYNGIATTHKFHEIVKDDKLATFIFSQPLKVKMIQEDLLYEGYRQMEEIMEASIYNKDGIVDPRIVTHKLKIINMLEDRVNGSVVQRSQSYVEQTSKFEKGHIETPEELDAVKAEIQKLKKSLGKQEVVDAKFTDIK